MVCACREELGYGASGSESTRIGFHELDCWCLVGRSGEMERGNFDLVDWNENNYQTRQGGLLLSRRACVPSFRAWNDGDRSQLLCFLVPGRADQGNFDLVGIEVQKFPDLTGPLPRVAWIRSFRV